MGFYYFRSSKKLIDEKDIEEIMLSDVELAMNNVVKEFDKFQERLKNNQPKHWERDVKIIEQLKKTTSEMLGSLNRVGKDGSTPY